METNINYDFLIPKAKRAHNKTLQLETKVNNFKEQIQNETSYEQKGLLRQKLQKTKSQKTNIGKKTRHIIGLLKTNLEFADQGVQNAEKNFSKTSTIYERKEKKFLENEAAFNEAVNRKKDYDRKTFKKDNYYFKQVNNAEKKKNSLILKVNNLNNKINIISDQINKIQEEKKFFEIETVEQIEIDFKDIFNELEKENDELGLNKAQKDYSLLKNKTQSFLNNFNHKIDMKTKKKEKLESNVADINLKIQDFESLIQDSQNTYAAEIERADFFKKDKILIAKTKQEQKQLNSSKKLLNRYNKTLNKNINNQEKINKNIEFLSTYIGVNQEFVAPTFSIPAISFNILEKLFLKDWFFIVIVSLMSAGAVLGSYMYLNLGIGGLNDPSVIINLKGNNGDYSTAIAFATSFLFARLLEGPLVGILDAGGSILTGVGIGIPGLLLSIPSLAFLMADPLFALLVGLVAGAILGLIVMIVRWLKPKKMMNFGTDIMVGAGNASGKFLGPLVIIFAASFQPLIGLGAGIGAAAFMLMKKPIIGGAILGVIFFTLIPLLA